MTLGIGYIAHMFRIFVLPVSLVFVYSLCLFINTLYFTSSLSTHALLDFRSKETVKQKMRGNENSHNEVTRDRAGLPPRKVKVAKTVNTKINEFPTSVSTPFNVSR